MSGCAKLLRERVRHAVNVLFIACWLMVGAMPAHGYFHYGGDFGGADFTPASGDTLGGTFANIGLFTIDPGSFVYGVTDSLTVYAREILIGGTLDGWQSPLGRLELYANNNLTVGGQLSGWSSIALSAQQQISLESSSVVDASRWGTSYGAVNGNALAGGSLTIVEGSDTIILQPVPLPPTALLLASGLVGIPLIRRRGGA